MKRELFVTEDGSNSIFVPELNENYHSQFGAKQESQHIFIDSALAQIDKEDIRIMEFGFGTGLNALLTYEYAQKKNIRIRYSTIEKYPLTENEYNKLSYAKDSNYDFFLKLHQCSWGIQNEITAKFDFYKEQIDIREFRNNEKQFDVVYFDAFAPDVQPHLWTKDIFEEIYKSISEGGILTTYTVKGSVRRILKDIGFKVEKIPGPPGKREITRAWKMI